MEDVAEVEVNRKRDASVEMIPVLVKCDRETQLRDIHINSDVFKIGRGRDSNQVLLDVSISRNHCVVERVDEKWTIIDTSKSGTVLNGTSLLRNVSYPLTEGDNLRFGDTDKFQYTFQMRPKDINPEAKKARVEEYLMDDVLAKQKSFAERQEGQMKEMQEKISQKQREGEELTARLEELVKQKEAVQGESEEKNAQIRALEEQIRASRDNQSQLENNLKDLVGTMEVERRNFEEKLNEEKRKWQEQLDMTKQEKETFERSMTEQMNNWKQQQLATVASEKEALEKKLAETQEALKAQSAMAEQFKNQQILLAGLPSNQDYVVFQVTEEENGKKLEILETIDLTGEDKPSTSKSKAVGEKIMSAMDEQFTCSICQELFIEAATLNCMHTFCSHCISEWRSSRRGDCPICRTSIISMNRALALDNFIDEAVTNLSPEERQRRAQVVKQRSDLEKAQQEQQQALQQQQTLQQRQQALRQQQMAQHQQVLRQQAMQRQAIQQQVVHQQQLIQQYNVRHQAPVAVLPARRGKSANQPRPSRR